MSKILKKILIPVVAIFALIPYLKVNAETQISEVTVEFERPVVGDKVLPENYTGEDLDIIPDDGVSNPDRIPIIKSVTEGVDISVSYWVADNSGEELFFGKFKKNTSYNAYVTIESKDGYELSDNIVIKAKYALGDASVTVNPSWQDNKVHVKSGYGTTYTSFMASLPSLNKFTVTFDSKGGTQVAPQTLIGTGATQSALVTKPEDPTKDDNTFLGWFTDENQENQFNFNSSISESITLYAGWKSTLPPVVVHTVFFGEGGVYKAIYEPIDPNESSNVDNDLTASGFFTVSSGESITLEAYPIEGYHFKGWYKGNVNAQTPEEWATDELLEEKTSYTFVPEGNPYVVPVFEKDAGIKEYVLTNDNATVIFKFNEGHNFELKFFDVLKLTDEELEAFELTKEQFEQLLSLMKDNTKEYGTLLSVFAIEINDGGFGYTNETTIKIKLTDEMKKYNSFKFIYLDDENNFKVGDIVDFKIEGDYLVGTLPHLSAYALVGNYIEPKTDNPQTGDNITKYALMLLLSISGFAGGLIYFKKRNLGKNN